MNEPTCQHGVADWCVYCELEARQADVAALRAQLAEAEHRSMVVDVPGHPVSAVCALTWCQHFPTKDTP
jgi:hypothetical protein